MTYKEFNGSYGRNEYMITYDSATCKMFVDVIYHDRVKTPEGVVIDKVVGSETLGSELVFNILDLWYYAIYGTFAETGMKYSLFDIAKEFDLLYCTITDITPSKRSEIVTSLLVQMNAYIQLSKYGVVSVEINDSIFDFEGVFKKDNVTCASDEIMYVDGVIIFYINGMCYTFQEDNIEHFSIKMYDDFRELHGKRRFYEIRPLAEIDDD